MGFTLRAALAELADDAAITVAELVPAVVAWARGPMADDLRRQPRRPARDDSRSGRRRADTRRRPRRYDAILLDVDNGPEGLSRQDNDGLYDAAGPAAARAALAPAACSRLVVGTRQPVHAAPQASRVRRRRGQGAGQRNPRGAPRHLDRHQQRKPEELTVAGRRFAWPPRMRIRASPSPQSTDLTHKMLGSYLLSQTNP